jgi:hypothetical protein
MPDPKPLEAAVDYAKGVTNIFGVDKDMLFRGADDLVARLEAAEALTAMIPQMNAMINSLHARFDALQAAPPTVPSHDISPRDLLPPAEQSGT